jgi:hypothetical protein
MAKKVPTSPKRFAHPFFVSAPPAERQPNAHGHRRMTDWSKEQLGPVPRPERQGRIALSDIIGVAGVQEIEQVGEIRFHALGDTGVNHAQEAEQVAEDMATDYNPAAGGLNPAFLFHLGDVIYGPDKEHHYGERFYRPYRHYPGKIIAIPGNHDGEVKAAADSPSLKDFRANFCAEDATVPQQASGSGIFRETMTLPGVYWMLEAPFVRVIGLYSNLLENPGYLEGRTEGKPDVSQQTWLEATLRAVGGMEERKALVIATHHPPYSQSGHSGSREMHQAILEICNRTKVFPDLFLSAHAHNYQRYIWRGVGGRQVPYIVAGTGGMAPQKVPDATGEPADESGHATYDRALASLGYLFVTVSATQLKTEFWPLGDGHTTPFDPIVLDLATHTTR